MAKSARPTTKSVKIDKDGFVTVKWEHVFTTPSISASVSIMQDVKNEAPKEIEEDLKVIMPLMMTIREKYRGQTVEVGLVEYNPGRPYESYTVTVGDPVEGEEWSKTTIKK